MKPKQIYYNDQLLYLQVATNIVGFRAIQIYL